MTGLKGYRILPPLAVLFLAAALPAGCAAAPVARQAAPRRAGYAIQVGAFSQVDNAVRLADLLHRNGLDAFSFRNDAGFYVVRFGDFPDRETARRQAEKLSGRRLIGEYYLAPPGSGGERRAPSSPRSGPSSTADPDMGRLTARTAERFIGIPYHWGGNNVAEGLDCSGFVKSVLNLAGITVPRTAAEQFTVGRTVPRSELREGDLVFFRKKEGRIGHVGIYTGEGRFVHAPRRGEEIKVTSLSAGSYAASYAGARRLF
jgi:hypothetical protein